MNRKEYDLVVFGGGGGLAVAMGAADRGLKVALIEKGPLGGTCLNRGCIPSKMLIEYAELAARIRDAGRFHFDASLNRIDRSKLLTETLAEVSASSESIAEHLPEGLTLYRGTGKFEDNKTLRVGEDTITGDRIVIATGARPRLPDIPGIDQMPVMTSDDVFKLEETPTSIVIIGGGYIATELGFFLSEMGTEVTVLDRNSALLHREDGEVSAAFTEQFRKHARLLLEHVVEGLTYEKGQFEVRVQPRKGGQGSALRAEKVLLAVGRMPNSDGIGLERTGVELDERGFIKVDGMLKATVPNIWAMGDVTGKHLFTHAASYQAAYLLEQFFEGREEPIDYEPMPHAVFSSPQVAAVGQTEEALQEQGVDYVTGKAAYTSAAMGRALKAEGGFAKFLVGRDGRILGCHILGPEASVLLHEVIPVMKWRNNIRSLTDIIHIHPSLSEVVRNATRKARAALEP